MNNEPCSEMPYLDKPDPWSSHSIIFGWLKSLPSGTKILDIGTATGMLGRRCVGLGFILRGIEPVPEWAEQAKEYYDEIIPLSLDHISDDFIAHQDVIILADVLEHTTDPEKNLRKIVELQNPSSQFLVSVPNIANIWVRLNLLFGKFDYADNGILDRTHLRLLYQTDLFGNVKDIGVAAY